MTLPAVCETLNRFIHFEHEQIDSTNQFYRTVSMTIHNRQWFDYVSINCQEQLRMYFYGLSLICIFYVLYFAWLCTFHIHSYSYSYKIYVNLLLIRPYGCQNVITGTSTDVIKVGEVDNMVIKITNTSIFFLLYQWVGAMTSSSWVSTSQPRDRQFNRRICARSLVQVSNLGVFRATQHPTLSGTGNE